MCSSNEAGETTTVNAIVYDVGHVAVLMPDERPIKHVVLEAPAERGMVGDLTWRYYIPESYAATLANENAKLRESLEYANNECEKESMEYLSTQDQNRKLRELVRDLYEMAYPECPSAFEAAFADRMRELGVDA